MRTFSNLNVGSHPLQVVLVFRPFCSNSGDFFVFYHFLRRRVVKLFVSGFIIVRTATNERRRAVFDSYRTCNNALRELQLNVRDTVITILFLHRYIIRTILEMPELYLCSCCI